MRYEWDETKRWANLRKHGIDFVECEVISAEWTVTTEDERVLCDERRFVTLGLLKGRVVSVAHT